MPKALEVAFRTGGVAGMFTVGLGLFGATVIIMIFQNTSSAILIGFGFGGSLLALFLRVGGGIFTKAADVGADLVGKVEAGIPEDDPRNPATIADNVGDNVGDCAGMAADLFESYEVTLVASIILGVPAFAAIFPHQPALWAAGALFPLGARAIGVLASIVGVFAVRATEKDKSRDGADQPRLPHRGHPHDPRHARVRARLRRQPQGRLDLERRLAHVRRGRRRSRARADRVAHHRVLHVDRDQARAGDRGVGGHRWSGHRGALRCQQRSRVVGVGDRRHRRCARVRDPARRRQDLQFSLYLVALTGMGMLATTGVVVSEDTFGPVADNAAGIAEMSGEFEGEPQRIMVSLDAVGNTTKAVTKGFAIGSAVIAAVALFSSYIETIKNELPGSRTSPATSSSPILLTAINVADPKMFIGLLIGGSIAFLFSSFAIRAVAARRPSSCKRCGASSPTARS